MNEELEMQPQSNISGIDNRAQGLRLLARIIARAHMSGKLNETLTGNDDETEN